MRKLKNILLVLVVAILCIGCGKEEEKIKTFNKELAKENISKLTFKDSDFTFTESENMNNVDAFKVYGVDTSKFTDSLSYISNNVVDPSMYLIVKVKDEDKSVLKFQMKEMFDKYYSAYNNYYPKEAKMITDRLEKEYEGYLIYIVSHDNDSVYQAIEKSFK